MTSPVAAGQRAGTLFIFLLLVLLASSAQQQQGSIVQSKTTEQTSYKIPPELEKELGAS